jgi:hypothetical protein
VTATLKVEWVLLLDEPSRKGDMQRCREQKACMGWGRARPTIVNELDQVSSDFTHLDFSLHCDCMPSLYRTCSTEVAMIHVMYPCLP